MPKKNIKSLVRSEKSGMRVFSKHIRLEIKHRMYTHYWLKFNLLAAVAELAAAAAAAATELVATAAAVAAVLAAAAAAAASELVATAAAVAAAKKLRPSYKQMIQK